MRSIFVLPCLWVMLFSCTIVFAEAAASFRDASTHDQRIARLEESMKMLENKLEETARVSEYRFEEMMKVLMDKRVSNQKLPSQDQNVAGLSESVLDRRVNGLEASMNDLEEMQGTAPRESQEFVAAGGALENKIYRLEESVKDLQSRASIMDMTEEIRKVQEYVCKNGHVYSIQSEDGRCPACGLKQKSRDRFKKFKFARRESISERIGAAVDEAFEKQVIIGASGTGVIQQLLSSDKEEKGFASGSFDLLFIAKPLLYTTFFIDLEAIGGDGPDELFDSFSGLNDDSGSFQDDDGLDRISVREVWLQSLLLDQRLKLVGGKIDLTNYFDSNAIANDETSQFITSAFVNNPTMEVPENGPGLVAFFDTERGWNFGLGLQSADNSGSDITDDMYAIGEIGYRSHKFFGLVGNYRLWGRINGGRDDNAGFGASMDQNLSTRLTAFARYGANEADSGDAEVASAWSLGARYRSPFFSRVNDEIALAFGMLDSVGGDEESATELYYKFQLNDHFAITPNVQALFDPRGIGSEDTVMLAGIRTQIEF
ncbi:MAG: carbohydrate porin [Candidatus Brocadiaceae bacterium]|nr:carbohydrate porin [Candidatus Brocadiaceae bacterium]